MREYVIKRIKDGQYWTGLGWDIKSRAKRYRDIRDLDLVLSKQSLESLFVRYDSNEISKCHYVSMSRVKKAIIESL